MSKQHDIESLFNSKLSGLENTPSPEVWEKTALTLRHRSFLRFTPRRFNIYYIIASALIIGGIEISSLISKLDNTNPLPSTLNSPASISEDSSIANRPIANHPIVNNPIANNQTTKNVSKKNTNEAPPANRQSPIANRQIKSEISTSEENETHTKSITTPIIYFTPSTFEGCAPLTITLINSSMHVGGNSWHSNDPNILFTNGSISESSCTFEEPGEYTITLSAKDENNILHSHTELIIVHPSPTAEFEIADDEIYNYSLNASSYKWNILTTRIAQNALRKTISEAFNCPTPKYKDAATLELIVTNEFGCNDTAKSILPAARLPKLEFPTAFRPNNNGPTGGYYNQANPDNSIFYPTYNEVPATYKLVIFNKSGELIFETSEIQTGWDGYHKEALSPQGVYVYNCTGTWNNGEAFTFRGDITLILNW